MFEKSQFATRVFVWVDLQVLYAGQQHPKCEPAIRLVYPPSFNLLTPNVNYSGRTTPLTSKVAFYIFIQQI